MISNILLLTLSLVGLIESVYLIFKRWKNKNPICIDKNQCNLVLQSKYNKTLGIYNDVLGLIFYVFSSMIWLLLFVPSLYSFEFLMTLIAVYLIGLAIALIMTLRFVYLMAFKIKAWCFWCVGSAVTVALMTITTIISIFQ